MYTLKPVLLLNASKCYNKKHWVVLMVKLTER